MNVEISDRIAKNGKKAKYCIGCEYLHIGQLVDHNHCSIHYSDARTNGHGDKDIKCPHKKGNNIHLLIICNVLKVSSQHQTYCGIDTRWKRKISKTTNIKECACPICLLNRKLCEKCYWLSGTDNCWFMHDRDWGQGKSGECKDFISKAKGKLKYGEGHFWPSIDERNSDRLRNWRAFCEKTNPEQQK